MHDTHFYMNEVPYEAAQVSNLWSGSQNLPDERIESIPICLQRKT